jgi:hypothetical protein
LIKFIVCFEGAFREELAEYATVADHIVRLTTKVMNIIAGLYLFELQPGWTHALVGVVLLRPAYKDCIHTFKALKEDKPFYGYLYDLKGAY